MKKALAIKKPYVLQKDQEGNRTISRRTWLYYGIPLVGAVAAGITALVNNHPETAADLRQNRELSDLEKATLHPELRSQYVAHLKSRLSLPHYVEDIVYEDKQPPPTNPHIPYKQVFMTTQPIGQVVVSHPGFGSHRSVQTIN